MLYLTSRNGPYVGYCESAKLNHVPQVLHAVFKENVFLLTSALRQLLSLAENCFNMVYMLFDGFHKDYYIV